MAVLSLLLGDGFFFLSSGCIVAVLKGRVFTSGRTGAIVKERVFSLGCT